MKKIILLLVLTMTCKQVAFQGSAVFRCYNDEVVCYVKRVGGISCIAEESK